MNDTFTISADQHGSRLQDVLSARYPTYSVSSLLALLASGGAAVNGTSGTRHLSVNEGDIVEVSFPEEGLREVEPRRTAFDILYEDPSCIVINKPAGMAVVPERDARDYPLMSGMLYYLRNDSPYATGRLIRPMIVHRLDKDTTGALVIAKDLPALRDLSGQFESRTVHKEYLAIVRGKPPSEFEVALPITSKRVKGGRAVIDRRRGRPAATVVRAEEYFRGFALVRAVPKTGRMHQVRLHLKAAGYPLAVDPLYSGRSGTKPALYLSQFKPGYRPKAGRPEKPLIARQTLHAHRLQFGLCDESGDRKTVGVEAPLPRDMEVALKMLRKYRAES